jgi:AcrR family transcriptional regulator
MNRTYVSPLRQKQSESTRRRIVEAVARVLARGLTELSVPAVAVEAEVSVATVYRHFKNKQELVAGLERHYAEQIGITEFLEGAGSGMTLDQVVEAVPSVFVRRERLDPTLRAALASDLVGEYRRIHRPERLAPVEKLVRQSFPGRPEEELRHLRDLVAMLTSSAALRAFVTVAGSSPEEAGATVSWALRRLLAAERSIEERTG